MAAITTKPSFQVATTADALRQQRGQLNAIIAKGGTAAKTAQAQAEQVRQALLKVNKTAAATPVSTPQQSGYDQSLVNANSAQNNLLEQAQGQPQFTGQTSIPIQQFNPGNFQDQYKTSYDATLGEFNRTNSDKFAQDKQDYNDYIVQHAIDPTSDVATKLYKQRVSDPQTNANQAAMNNAVGAGLNAQNQAFGQNIAGYGQNLAAQGQQFGQGATTYQMPYQALSSLSPYFSAQAQGNLQNNQNQFAAGQQTQQNTFANQQAQQAFEYQKYLQAHAKSGGGGGGGALSLADQMALQNNAFYNNAALLAGQGGNTGSSNQTLNSGIQGIAAGVGQGVVSSLTR